MIFLEACSGNLHHTIFVKQMMINILGFSDTVSIHEYCGIRLDNYFLTNIFEMWEQANGDVGDDGQQIGFGVDDDWCTVPCIAVAHLTCRQVEDCNEQRYKHILHIVFRHGVVDKYGYLGWIAFMIGHRSEQTACHSHQE